MFLMGSYVNKRKGCSQTDGKRIALADSYCCKVNSISLYEYNGVLKAVFFLKRVNCESDMSANAYIILNYVGLIVCFSMSSRIQTQVYMNSIHVCVLYKCIQKITAYLCAHICTYRRNKYPQHFYSQLQSRSNKMNLICFADK